LLAERAGRDYVLKDNDLKLIEDYKQGRPSKKAAQKGRKK
jgi:hypothetical protein